MFLRNGRQAALLRSTGAHRQELADVRGAVRFCVTAQTFGHQLAHERGDGALLPEGALAQLAICLLVELDQGPFHEYMIS